MDYNILLDLATDLGYELAMCGAETFRVEESVSRVLSSYGIASEVFAIPNYLIVTVMMEDGTPITRMRRIGSHGNDLDAVEKFSGLSRAYCSRRPEPKEAQRWLEVVRSQRRAYPVPIIYLGYFLGALGFGLLFGGNFLDGLCAGICGILVGLVIRFLDAQDTNQFFRTIAASFLMALLAYAFGAMGIAKNPDAITIGALMILVPGLLFTNAMRDIIYGDTNSGINRIVQVFLIAAALAVGTATAWSLAERLWGAPVSAPAVDHSVLAQCLFACIGCFGFSILFNIHGPGGILCTIGGIACWVVFWLSQRLGFSEILSYFWASLFASLYSEIMARIRKYPAISYLLVSAFPLIPGAGVYYTMNFAVRGEMDMFAYRGMNTAAIAGIMAVGILLGSTVFRMYAQWKSRRMQRQKHKISGRKLCFLPDFMPTVKKRPRDFRATPDRHCRHRASRPG
ncbi:MAG: threonine/serine exporter ThrE family protein [Oscillospiraceae bacterium]